MKRVMEYIREAEDAFRSEKQRLADEAREKTEEEERRRQEEKRKKQEKLQTEEIKRQEVERKLREEEKRKEERRWAITKFIFMSFVYAIPFLIVAAIVTALFAPLNLPPPFDHPLINKETTESLQVFVAIVSVIIAIGAAISIAYDGYYPKN